MATKITKWTRERGGRHQDFADATRRSHQPLKFHLSPKDAAAMRMMARREEEEDGRGDEEARVAVGREDAVVRRRIERLRAQLHHVTFAQGDDGEPVQEEAAVAAAEKERSVGHLQRQAARRRAVLVHARGFVPRVPDPTSPKTRSRVIHAQVSAIHAQVLEGREVQVKEKAERLRQRHLEEDQWAQLVCKRKEDFEQEKWEAELKKESDMHQLQTQLNSLCAEKEALREQERESVLRRRQEIEEGDKVYARYRQHVADKIKEEKDRKREELLREIEEVRATQVAEAVKEDALRDEDLRYSRAKRAYARRVKQRILDKMKGKRSVVGPSLHTHAHTRPQEQC